MSNHGKMSHRFVLIHRAVMTPSLCNRPLAKAPGLRAPWQTALLASALWVAAGLCTAGSLPAAARAEVDALLTRLQKSGCEFQRNGSWYSGAEAKAHLLKKLDYLDGKNAVQSTEQFIELGASSSSASGKPYQVRCGNAPVVNSGPWLQGELKTLRAGSAK
jgi:hypothetical protein